MRKTPFIRCLFISVLIAFGIVVAPSYAQDSGNSRPKILQRIIKGDGWSLPDTDQCVVVVPRRIQQRPTPMKNRGQSVMKLRLTINNENLG